MDGAAYEGRHEATAEPIAVIGASCRLPGAPDLDALARLLDRGGDAVSEIPDERWTKSQFLHPERGQPGKAYTFAAGVIDNVYGFDTAFFGISPREAAQMDPQQRLLLELAHEAIEDAGLIGSRLAGSQTGVFVGGSAWDHTTLHTGDPANTDAYTMTGLTLCSLANRISYIFDLRGPSFTVDTACSSSLVALHLACEAIRQGQVGMALVGGVNMLLAPLSYVGFCRASMLSPRGRCHAFDQRADGYVRAEGGGVIALKPLRDALAEGDPIRAVIRGTGVNSDGRTTGLSLPSKAAQAALLREVYGRFGLDPDDLAYLEAHGTGTPAGDPIEAGALGEVLGGARGRALPIGSVKTNLGHLEAGSGMAGLLKAMLVLQRGRVPASLHCETPNPQIPFGELNLRLVPEAFALAVAPETLVGVNSFGFGGTNAHAVLGPAPDILPRSVGPTPDPLPLLLSARSDAALRALGVAWRDRLDGAGPAETAALLRGAARAREQHPIRLAVLGDDAATLRGALDTWLAGRDSAAAIGGTAVAGEVAFAFSGNGSQWAGMAADALAHSPRFVRALAEVDAALAPRLGWSVAERLRDADAEAMRDTAVAQPLLFAVQVAITIALREAGVHAAACFGHSVGEVAAAWAAGALTLDQAALVITSRSARQGMTAGTGRMAVLGLPLAEAQAALDGLDGIEVAAENSGSACTVAGPDTALDALATRAAERRWSFTRLDLNYAFHSAAMDPIRAPLLGDLAGLSPRRTAGTLVSTVTGARLAGPELTGEYWWRNVREPVRFAAAARALVADGVRVFVEIGPHPVLQAYLHDALRAGDAGTGGRVIATLGRRPASRDPFAVAAARVHVSGPDLSGIPAFDGPIELRGLPHYPWQREFHTRLRTGEATDTLRAATDHPLLGFRRGDEPSHWLRHLDVSAEAWLADHVVGGTPVLPAAAIIDMALAAAAARHPDATALDLLDLEINRALVLEDGASRETRFTVVEGAETFELASRPRLAEDGWLAHVAGRLAVGTGGGPLLPAPAPGRDPVRRLDADALYELTGRIGLEYGPAFRTVVGIDVLGPSEALVRLVPGLGAAARAEAGVLIDPPLLDGALQGLVAIAADRVRDDGQALLPWRFGRVRLLRRDGTQPVRAHLRVTHAGPRAICADIGLLDANGAVLAELVECWFVAVRTGTGAGSEPGFHVAFLPVPDPAAPAPDAGLLDAALAGPDDDDGQGAEAAVLGEVAAAIAARAALAEVPEVAGPLRDELAGWLSLAGAEDTAELPPLDAVLRSMLFDQPGSAADVALIARGAEDLPRRLRGAAAPPPAALLDQFLHHSPAGLRSARSLEAVVAAFARHWPRDRTLRLLQLGTESAGVPRALLRVLREAGVAVHYVAAASPDRLPALQQALAGTPDIAVRAWTGATEDRFDLVLGLHALTDGIDPASLRATIAPGGVLLCVEPLPGAAWSLAGLTAEPRAAVDWIGVLSEAGLTRIEARELPPSLWSACLIGGRAPEQAPSAVAPDPVLLAADPEDELAGRLADALRGQGVPVRRCRTQDVTGHVAGAGRVVLLPGTDAPEAMALLASLAEPLSAAPVPLTLALRADAVGDPLASALTGVRRVLANEAPEIPVRLVRLGRDLDAADAVERLAGEVLRPDAEAEIAWSASGRRAARARPGLPQPVAEAGEAVLDVRRPGLLDTLGWRELPDRAPAEGEVAISVRAAGLNFRDVMWAMGLLPDEALLHGFAGPTLGLECAGVVDAVGPGVTGLQPGDRVMAFAPASLATRAITRQHAVVRLPDGLSFEDAATVPVAFLTTAYALGRLAGLRAGETVLIHGGAGGVGLAAIQYALHRGAVVFATAGSESKRALLRQLGVAHVLDSRSLRFADEITAITGGVGLDVVLNSLSGDAMDRSLRLLRPFGRFLELGKRDLYGNTAVGLRPFRHNVSYFAIDADQLPNNRPELAAELLAEVAGLLAEGALRPLPHRVFGYDEVEDAFRLMQGAGHIGKIVLVPPASGLGVDRAVPEFSLRADGTHVVTGGLSGFGLETALWLADHGARHFALISRRGEAAPEAATALAALAARGATARAIACDVADAVALEAALDRVRAEMSPIRGVVHAAMVMDDGFLPALDAARFALSLGPKWHGAEALDTLTRRDPVGLFLLFSSVTTALGNPGQGNYVAANAALEAVAERRHAAGLPALAVGWGPIADVGYLSRTRDVSDALARRLGADHATARQALSALPAMIASGLPVVMAGGIAWGSARKGLKLLDSSLFRDFGIGATDSEAGGDLRSLVAGRSAEDARDIVAGLLAEEIAGILKLPAERIDPARKLAELGMDSLMAVELRLAAESRFGVTLPLFSLAEGATLNALAARLVKPLLSDDDASQDAAASLVARYESTTIDAALAEDIEAIPERPSYAAQAQNTA